eukprot:gene13171-13301_t
MQRPVSPSLHRQLEARSSPYFQVALYAGGQVLAVCICLLLWVSWDVLSAFQEPLLWAWLSSLSLRDVKRFLVNTARKELQTSPFITCCAKLVFLPLVILWQLFEEVREKLQSKYSELQAKSQVTAAGAGSSSNSVAGGQGSAPTAGASVHPQPAAADVSEDDEGPVQLLLETVQAKYISGALLLVGSYQPPPRKHQQQGGASGSGSSGAGGI